MGFRFLSSDLLIPPRFDIFEWNRSRLAAAFSFLVVLGWYRKSLNSFSWVSIAVGVWVRWRDRPGKQVGNRDTETRRGSPVATKRSDTNTNHPQPMDTKTIATCSHSLILRLHPHLTGSITTTECVFLRWKRGPRLLRRRVSATKTPINALKTARTHHFSIGRTCESFAKSPVFAWIFFNWLFFSQFSCIQLPGVHAPPDPANDPSLMHLQPELHISTQQKQCHSKCCEAGSLWPDLPSRGPPSAT